MTLYGINEIATILGAKPGTVWQWLHRGQMPIPTQRLRCGPVWVEADIEPWIRSRKSN